MSCMQLTDYSAYAAQIAWWLAFFPPEQFIILTMDDLRDPRRRMRVRPPPPYPPIRTCGCCTGLRSPPLKHNTSNGSCRPATHAHAPGRSTHAWICYRAVLTTAAMHPWPLLGLNLQLIICSKAMHGLPMPHGDGLVPFFALTHRVSWPVCWYLRTFA